MDDKPEWAQGLAKAALWLTYISIGVIAKLAFDSRNDQLTRKAIAIKSILSIFVGYISCVTCENLGYSNWIKFVCPVTTLLGESLLIWAMTNWYDVLSRYFPKIFPKKKIKP